MPTNMTTTVVLNQFVDIISTADLECSVIIFFNEESNQKLGFIRGLSKGLSEELVWKFW